MQKDANLTLTENIFPCLYAGPAICQCSLFNSSPESVLYILLRLNLNQKKPCLKPLSVEHTSRVLSLASETVINARPKTFNLNLRGTSNNDIFLYFRQASHWYEQTVKCLLMENDTIVLI